MDEQVILGNFVDEVYYKQCNHEGSDINKSPLLMSKSTSNMYHEGYDRKSLLCRLTTGDFNPRTHKGYDDTFPHPRLYFTEFQSTYPQRVRPYSVFLFFGSNHFNPRTHKGYDSISFPVAYHSCISIHVPTKGTTQFNKVNHAHI